MRRNSGSSFTFSGAHTTSPGTPDYSDYRFGKGWCSERVPLPARRNVASTALIPFNSGRTLPSKWDDAERWITSPILGYGTLRNSVAQPQKRVKSKSGPLGPNGLVYLGSGYSPANPGGSARVNSPLTTGVFMPDGLSVHYESEVDAISSNSLRDGNVMTRSVSVPGLSDLLNETCAPSYRDNNGKEVEVEERVSCRDMATQMSPQGSTHTSFSSFPFGKLDIRDVQVDKNTTTATHTRWMNQTETRNIKGSPSSSWGLAQPAKSKTKLEREKAKINAWENLQKAKADAAIQKLEMKLEKKRSAAMDKIRNKLRGAEMKAQSMRSQAFTTSHKGITPNSLFLRISSLSSCFFCTKTC